MSQELVLTFLSIPVTGQGGARSDWVDDVDPRQLKC